jgi:hypothetical protein
VEWLCSQAYTILYAWNSSQSFVSAAHSQPLSGNLSVTTPRPTSDDNTGPLLAAVAILDSLWSPFSAYPVRITSVTLRLRRTNPVFTIPASFEVSARPFDEKAQRFHESAGSMSTLASISQFRGEKKNPGSFAPGVFVGLFP